MHLAPAHSKIFFSVDAGKLKFTDVVAMCEWLDVLEIPVVSMLFSFFSKPFYISIMIKGVPSVQLFNGRQNRRGFLSRTLNQQVKLMTILHTSANWVDFDTIH